MNKRKLAWSAFALVLVVFGTIQFIPGPPLQIPAELPAGQREAHRLLNFEGIANFRDLGGYASADGRAVKWGVLYRTATLANASDHDLEGLGRLQLASLVDFRSSAEKEHEPNRLPDPAGFAVVEIPVLDEGNNAMVTEIMERIESGDMEGLDPNRLMLDSNRQFASQFVPQFRQFIEVVMAADGAPVAWHCSAGKDRTGFAAAILLRLLGVPQDLVMQDYMASKENALRARRSQLIMLRLFKGEETEEKITMLLGVEEAWLAAAFDEIDQKWGSFDNYARQALQLDETDIAHLRATLLSAPATAG